jgi:hypothetical protein
MKEKYTIKQLRELKMTAAEKASVWDGVLRRVTDYPEGEYPFGDISNDWDGVLRRKSDFPEGLYPGTENEKEKDR